jgi:starch phosphorylase
MNPKKFQNKTNGVTPRRWVRCCNPGLARLYNEYIEESKWLTNLDELKTLAPKATDPDFQFEWNKVKQENKKALAQWVLKNTGYAINENSMFDVQVKRIHEYKRQLMNALYMIHR